MANWSGELWDENFIEAIFVGYLWTEKYIKHAMILASLFYICRTTNTCFVWFYFPDDLFIQLLVPSFAFFDSNISFLLNPFFLTHPILLGP